MNYQVVMLPLAKTSLHNARTYIAQKLNNPIAAKNLYNSVLERIKDLKYNPFLYPIVDSEPHKSMGVRFFPVKNYIIFYKADETLKTVFIFKIAHAAQSPENRLDGI